MKVQAIDQHQQTDVEMDGAIGAKMRMLIGPADGATNFHMRHFELAPGGHTPHHKHDYEHEVLVLGGEGIVKGGQDERPIKAGDIVFMPPNEMHQFVNAGSGPLSFICSIPAPEDCCK